MALQHLPEDFWVGERLARTLHVADGLRLSCSHPNAVVVTVLADTHERWYCPNFKCGAEWQDIDFLYWEDRVNQER